MDLAVEIQQIPSPTFYEEERAGFVESYLAQIGLEDVAQDALHNVYGCFPGRGEGDPLIISAHTDTVFGLDTDLSVTRTEKRVSGPGIADNSLGVAGLLTLARTFKELGVHAARDVWFVGNVGEEGMGDLRGMRAVVERHGRRGIFLVLEGGLFGYICHEAIGVRRYRISVEGPGGHSWGSFGTPSAVHILGELIASIVRLNVPADPKTTFNVGVIEGGTTVNSIARSASMLLDLRSEEPQALEDMVEQVRGVVASQERPEGVEIYVEQIGSRPMGRVARRTQLVRWAAAALKEVDCRNLEYTMASTDANIPLSYGLPAVCIGLSRSGNTHRPDEYLEIETIPSGLGQATLLALAASGIE
ncbi:MAG TPA: M20/M25/M40 family metallo-hydrolase [Candidatus Binatia bacterium]|nr:M20/M25/M40 family metallo-hydrolase [Candidatus Binatia bacterium]